MNQTSLPLPSLSAISTKKIEAKFDGGRLSSDGGVVLLREADRRLRLCERLAGCIVDERDQALVTHTMADLFRARSFAIACGFEDGNDLTVLRTDPALKLACGRMPESGLDLASQPTICRFENAPDAKSLEALEDELIAIYCDSFEHVPARIVLDIDETFDAVHGGQQLALFNAHYGELGYQPIVIFDESGRPLLARLRPGKRPSGKEAALIIDKTLNKLGEHWPKTSFMYRGDSHYGVSDVLDVMDHHGCSFVFGLASNPRLNKLIQPFVEDTATRRATSNKEVLRRFHAFTYKADNWSKPYRVVARIEASSHGADVRLIVTNLEGRAKAVYEKIYCRRGCMENMIKDFKRYTAADRTSCQLFDANQLRLTLHVAAYWLMHSLRLAAPKRSAWRTATLHTIRLAFLKIAVRVEELKSKVKLAFCSTYPNQATLIALAGRLAASGP